MLLRILKLLYGLTLHATHLLVTTWAKIWYKWLDYRGDEAQVLDDLAVPLSTLVLLEGHKYDQFSQTIVANKASDLKLGFRKNDEPSRSPRW